MAESILQNTSATISATFSVDGEIPDPAPTDGVVEISRSDGSVLVASTDADDQGDGEFSYTLPQADTASLDLLTARWTATIDGQPSTITTQIAIVGGFYFSISEFRARYASDPAVAALTAAEIADARATAEEIIEGLDTEDGTHQAFVPRVETFHFSGPMGTIEIPRYHLRAVNLIEFDGVEQNLDNLLLLDSAIEGGFWGRGSLTVEVEHGLDAPPSRIKDAAMILAYHRAVNGPIDDRATRVETEGGGVVTLSTPGLRGAITGIPEVDSAIAQYRKRRIRPTSVYIGDRSGSGGSRLDFFI